MKKFVYLFTLLLVGLCVFQSCKRADQEFLITNEDFVSEVSSYNKLEIMAGEMARLKSQSDSVKSYAQRTIYGQLTTQSALSSLAATKGITIQEGLNPAQKANYDLLGTVSAEVFDKEFAYLMIFLHRETYNLFLQAAQPNGVEDAELSRWAASKLPEILDHLDAAEDLYRIAAAGQ